MEELNISTEKDSEYSDLEKKSVIEIITDINYEDKKVAFAVEKSLQQINNLVQALIPKMKQGGRLFYIGAGTSGRLGIVDASECPPTFGVPQGMVVGLIAGGDKAIRTAVEGAEDDPNQAINDLDAFAINQNDFVMGIAASGRTPYVVGGLIKCKERGIATGCITNSAQSKLAQVADYPIEVVVGPEYVTGSTRMKSGTAQKMVLNIITTTTMIALGRVKGNKMVDMQIANHKLHLRGIRFISQELNIEPEEAEILLKKYGNVRDAISNFKKIID